MADLAPTEYLYELRDVNWDDGPLGNYQLYAHPITRKTARRIYFTYLNQSRTSFVDRQKIEADGEVYHGYTLRRLHLAPPEIPDRPKRASLPELKQQMADAHPDRGGTDEAFIAARQRYKTAKARQDGASS
ncbi:hypothetical protein ACWF8U_20510 [Streptomyces olivaceus]